MLLAHTLGFQDTPMCPHCNAAIQDDVHLWVCTHPAISRARELTDDQDELALLAMILFLPRALKLGLPIAMQTNDKAPFWSSLSLSAEDMQGLTDAQKLAVGINFSSTLEHDISPELQFLQQHFVTNARTTFRAIIGAEQLQLDSYPHHVESSNVCPIVDVFFRMVGSVIPNSLSLALALLGYGIPIAPSWRTSPT